MKRIDFRYLFTKILQIYIHKEYTLTIKPTYLEEDAHETKEDIHYYYYYSWGCHCPFSHEIFPAVAADHHHQQQPLPLPAVEEVGLLPTPVVEEDSAQMSEELGNVDLGVAYYLLSFDLIDFMVGDVKFKWILGDAQDMCKKSNDDCQTKSMSPLLFKLSSSIALYR